MAFKMSNNVKKPNIITKSFSHVFKPFIKVVKFYKYNIVQSNDNGICFKSKVNNYKLSKVNFTQ